MAARLLMASGAAVVGYLLLSEEKRLRLRGYFRCEKCRKTWDSTYTVERDNEHVSQINWIIVLLRSKFNRAKWKLIVTKI